MKLTSDDVLTAIQPKSCIFFVFRTGKLKVKRQVTLFGHCKGVARKKYLFEEGEQIENFTEHNHFPIFLRC